MNYIQNIVVKGLSGVDWAGKVVKVEGKILFVKFPDFESLIEFEIKPQFKLVVGSMEYEVVSLTPIPKPKQKTYVVSLQDWANETEYNRRILAVCPTEEAGYKVAGNWVRKMYPNFSDELSDQFLSENFSNSHPTLTLDIEWFELEE